MNESEKKEGRFHILQPSRDLESNWDLDVAKQLEKYLLEICSSGKAGDGGPPSINFAEAALLVQGSTQIYSRKVEFLYSLVLQVLEFISQKRQDIQEKSSIRTDGTDADAVVDDDREEFLNLDDIQVEANIDLDDDLNKDDISFGRSAKPPASLLVLEGDCLDATGDMGELASYQIATSSLHRDFLLLDPCDAEAVNDFLKGNVCQSAQVSKQCGSSARSKSRRSFFRSPSPRPGPGEKSGLGKYADGVTINAMESNCNFEMHNDIGPEPEQNDLPHDIHHAEESTSVGGCDLEEDLDDDPWAPLNPHEPGTLKVKPFKKVSFRTRLKPSPRQNTAFMCFPHAKLRRFVTPEFADAIDVERMRTNQSLLPYQKLRESLLSGTHRAFDDPTINEDNDCVNDINDFEEDVAGLFDDNYMDVDLPAFCGMDATDVPNHNDGDNVNEDHDANTDLERLCQSHLDALLATIAETEKQTELAANVSTWKQRIEHSLEEQDKRPPFDIHEYGERVLDKFSLETDCGCSRSFGDLVGGQPKYEVARTFSALLQLVNNGNVSLDRGHLGTQPNCFTATNPFYVNLVSNNRRHEEMLKYRAPSMGAKCHTTKKRISSPKENGDDHCHPENKIPSNSPTSPSQFSPSGKFSRSGKKWGIRCTPEGKKRRQNRLTRLTEPV